MCNKCDKCPCKDNDKFTTKDLYAELFHCRDFELQHLWQRSIFLAGFMVALFTLYGSFISDNLSHKLNFDVNNTCVESNYITIKGSLSVNENLSNQTTLHYFAFFIGCVGIILSQLFIMMIKGSKRWYEQYEQSIFWFYENDSDLFSDELNKKLEAHLGDEKYPHFGDLRKIKGSRINNSLFNTNAGYYSVSRINIVLGQLLCLVWIGISGFHLFNIFNEIFTTDKNIKSLFTTNNQTITSIFIFLVTSFTIFLLVWLFTLVLTKKVNSQD
ncbi:MAG: hypothetical protein E7064_07860 [Spirochaetaceae bacterium]|nr:hypothetical protein [Spirochaetaceae bacterium]